MKRWKQSLLFAALGGLLVWFLADAESIRQTMQEALALCARSVIPAMFPFLVVSTLLLRLGLGELLAPLLAEFMEPLFRVDGAGSTALLLGFLGGYPIGAQTAAELYRQGVLNRVEAERLLTFCNNSNPVFLISVLGTGIFGSVRAGVWLWLIHLLSALLTGLFFRNCGKPISSVHPESRVTAKAVRFSTAFVTSVGNACTGTLTICAFVSFFYLLSRPLAMLGGRLGAVLVGATELFSLTPLLTADRFGFLLAAGAAGWGGLSVLCQTAAVLSGSGLSVKPCVRGKLVQCGCSVVLAALLYGHIFSA